jgi:SNF2 family DNA or RNA helicase
MTMTVEAELLQARKRIEELEAREAAAEQAGEVSEARARLQRIFRERAHGKVWYEGNDEVEPILPFQWEGMQFGAAAKRYVLADGMGLGKTRQSIGWLDLVQAKKVLIVCLPDICDQFAGEVMTLAPHRTVFNLYKKSKDTRHEMIDEIMQRDEGVVIVNFEIWRRDKDFLGKLIGWQIDSLIVDEAHSIKSTASANFKAIETLVTTSNTCANCKGTSTG